MCLLLGLAILVVLPVMLALSILLNGYVLSVLWGWFIVPLFGLPKLSIPAALGIALVVSVLTHQSQQPTTTENEPEDRKGAALQHVLWSFSESILRPLLLLLYGYLIHRFM